VTSLHIIYASTSGHTEFVVDTLIASLSLQKAPGDMEIEKQRAELTQADDLLRGDILVLASSTWNTGGPEGQLNPHMFALLTMRATAIDLKGKKVAVIGLGDDRYHFTCAAADLLEEYVTSHGGELIQPTLRIINEPYNQTDKVEAWASSLLKPKS
jgi:flavodoxin I